MANRTSHTFLAAVTGVASSFSTNWYALDYRFDSEQNRSFIVQAASTADRINIEVTNNDILKNGTSNVTFATAESFIGANRYVATLNGPFAAVRITKIGAAGTATVIGIV